MSVNNLIVSKDMETMHIRDFERWLNSEHAILDDSERRYLRCVVLPFYDRVACVTKSKYDTNKYYINIYVKSKTDSLSYESVMLPIFISTETGEDNMYSGMECDKDYSLKELGIFK